MVMQLLEVWTGWRGVVSGSLFYASLSLVCLVFVAPVLWLVSASVMTPAGIHRPRPPPALRPQNFPDIFQGSANLGRYFANSLFVTSSVVVLNVLFCTLTGYSLA